MAAAVRRHEAGPLGAIFRTPGMRARSAEIESSPRCAAFFGKRLMGYRGTSPRTGSPTRTGAGPRSREPS